MILLRRRTKNALNKLIATADAVTTPWVGRKAPGMTHLQQMELLRELRAAALAAKKLLAEDAGNNGGTDEGNAR